MIYHYSTLEYAVKIFETGYLKVSANEKSLGVKPSALWLSKNPVWEPSSSKGIIDHSTGESRSLNFQEQHSVIGCTRFIVPFKKEDAILTG